VIVRPLDAADLDAALDLLATAFLDDAGMVAILRGGLPGAIRPWFAATLGMLSEPPGRLLGAFEGGRLIGVLVGSHSRGASAGRQLGWLARVTLTLGPAVAWRTIGHDRQRAKGFPPGGALLVEFVAVDPDMRGRGVARHLFEVFHGAGEPVWLETTRVQNLTIFARLGYRQEQSFVQDGVTYYAMLRSKEIR